MSQTQTRTHSVITLYEDVVDMVSPDVLAKVVVEILPNKKDDVEKIMQEEGRASQRNKCIKIMGIYKQEAVPGLEGLKVRQSFDGFGAKTCFCGWPQFLSTLFLILTMQMVENELSYIQAFLLFSNFARNCLGCWKIKMTGPKWKR